jgi:cold shock CspA family protein
MKYFGTVKAFDEANGHGSIEPDTGGPALSFGQSASSWNRVAPPRPGQRLSYDLHHANGQPSAVNVETI